MLISSGLVVKFGRKKIYSVAKHNHSVQIIANQNKTENDSNQIKKKIKRRTIYLKKFLKMFPGVNLLRIVAGSVFVLLICFNSSAKRLLLADG